MELLAQGRDCDVFDLGDGTVLRRRRSGRSLESEAEVMQHVGSHGYPVPVLRDLEGPDMVLDRIDGPTMASSLLENPTPDRVSQGARLLAQLHSTLHEIPPMTRGGCVVHLDLHPENVLMSDDGPVVIDWTNARDGRAELDVAMTWAILEPLRTIPEVGVFLDAFLDSVGRDFARSGLAAAVDLRLSDANITADERDAVQALLAVADPRDAVS